MANTVSFRDGVKLKLMERAPAGHQMSASELTWREEAICAYFYDHIMKLKEEIHDLKTKGEAA